MTRNLTYVTTVLMIVISCVVVGSQAAPVQAQSVCPGVTEIPVSECNGLISFYNSTGGSNWSDKATNNWNVTTTPCSWAGVKCSGGYVTEINRIARNLTGSLSNLSSLPNLVALRVSGNNLSGNLPNLGSKTKLRTLSLDANKFSGTIRTMPSGLQVLHLSNNRLIGSVPALPTTLTNLSLQNNQLSGNMPFSLTGLTNLASLNIGYNKITRGKDIGVIVFLNNNDPDWADTQTLPPTNVTATATGFTTIEVSWTPIAYTGDGGFYRVKYATSSGGPYTEAGTTTNKSASSYEVTGLDMDQTYYFKVETHTPAHGSQQNALTSSESTVASTTTQGCANQSEIPKSECDALVALYDSTDGPNWWSNRNWKQTGPCFWMGITCDNGHVTRFYSNYNNLVGQLPDLSDLTHLRILSLGDNKITDSLSESDLPPSLEQLHLSGNNFNGSIPNLTTFNQLSTLNLAFNQFNGTIPSTLPNSLESISLSKNQLSGSFPNLSHLTNVKLLRLDNNQLDGNIPTTFTNLNSLSTLDIGYNMLTASNPTVKSFLDTENPGWANSQTIPPSTITATVLSASSIRLTWDAIPYTSDGGGYEIYSATKSGGPYTLLTTTANKSVTSYEAAGLTFETDYYFIIKTHTPAHGDQQNDLTSDASTEVPATTLGCDGQSAIPVVECETLLTLYDNTDGPNWSDTPANGWKISDNPCNWAGITCLGGQVTTINRFNRGLAGSLPNLTNLANLKHLELGSNNIIGNVPEAYLPQTLQTLDLGLNKLTGSIPNLTAFGQLSYLSLGANQLVGTIPSTLPPNLEQLYLNDNQFNGDVPTTFTTLTNLSTLNIGYNTLIASDPTVLNFLNSKDPDWADTQTVAPTNVTLTPLSESAMQISWSPIPYTSDGGYYQIGYATSPGGPYQNGGTTANKSAASHNVTNLNASTTYYFVLQTYTPAHGDQQNDLTSQFSQEVFSDTLDPNLTINNITVPEGDNGTTNGSFTISLNRVSGKTVTVDYQTADNTANASSDYNSRSGKVTFNPGDTSKMVNVSVIGNQIDDDNRSFFVNLTNATNANITNNRGIATIIDNDVAGITLAQSGGNTAVVEGLTNDSYTIRLNTIPTTTVTITIDPDNQTDLGNGRGAPINLNFAPNATALNAQTITVTPFNDSDTEFNHTSQISHTVSSGDVKYDGKNVSDVTVTITDDDIPSVRFTQSGGNTSMVEGNSDTYQVRLGVPPAAPVQLRITPDNQTNLGNGAGKPITLTFAANSSALNNQSVTVTAVDDSDLEGNHSSILSHVIISTDTNYTGSIPHYLDGALASSNITAQITDNDVSYAISADTATVTEGNVGATQISFTVQRSGAINTESGQVRFSLGGLAISGNDYNNVSPSNGRVNFAIGEDKQTITLDVLGDFADEIDETIEVTLNNPSTSSGTATITTNSATTIIEDDETVDVVITHSDGNTTVGEGGPNDNFTIRLNSIPTATVIIIITPDGETDLGNGVGNAISRNFAPNTTAVNEQIITVSANDDVAQEGNHTSILSIAVSSNDSNYDKFSVSNITVNIVDNDVPAVLVSAMSGNTTEGGGKASFTMRLQTQPSANVVITLSSNDTSEGTAIPTSVTFTPTNWEQFQTVTVTGIDDSMVDGDQTFTIVTNPANSADGGYNNLAVPNVTVVNEDDDIPGFIVSAISNNTTEDGGQASFTIRLKTQPTANVNIPLSSSNLNEGTISSTMVTFNSSDWNNDKTVVVTGVDDAVNDGNVTYNIELGVVSSSDNNYQGLDPADVTVTNVDNDGPPPNQPPYFRNLTSKRTNENTPFIMTFRVYDAETIHSSLVVRFSSANQTLIPDNNIQLISIQGNLRTVKITPATNQHGTANIRLSLFDGQHTVYKTMRISVDPLNRAPVLVTPLSNQTVIQNEAFSYSFAEDSFTDAEDTPEALQYSARLLGGSPLPNWLTFNPVNRTFSGTGPTAGGEITVQVTATDTEGATAYSTFVITMETNDPPIAQNDVIVTTVDSAVTIAVLTNDNDPDVNDTLLITSISQPSHGTAHINGDTIIYTPQGGFAGVDEFTYTIVDSWGDTASANVTIVVNKVVAPPTPTPSPTPTIPNVVWLNDGTGVFTQSNETAPWSDDNPGVILGDINNDGIVDVIVGGSEGNGVWLNDGTGVFTQSNEIPPWDDDNPPIAIGILNNDDNLDVIVTDPDGNEVWLNDGTGVFTNTGQNLGNSDAIVLGDINNDGLDDIIFGAAVLDNENGVWLNDGTGIFTNTGQNLGDNHNAVSLIDLNNDGIFDIVTNSPNGNEIWLNDGTGIFTSTGQNLGDGDAVVLGDINNDNIPDALSGQNGADEVWLNDGTGIFTSTGQILDNTNTQAVVLGDIDNDGDLDSLVEGLNGSTVWLNDGTGIFTSTGQNLGDSNAVILGDINNDNVVDAVIGGQNGSTVWLNDGTGVFTNTGQNLGDSNAVILGDINNDNVVDAVIGGQNGSQVWLNDGTGVFTSTGQSLGDSNAIVLGDINNDDVVDAVIGGQNGNQVWLNDGTGVFTSTGQNFGGHSNTVILGDIDNDGDLDSIVGGSNASTIWLNSGQGQFEAGGVLDIENLSAIELIDLEDDGDTDIIATSPNGNEIWFNTGSGIFNEGPILPSNNSTTLEIADLDNNGFHDIIIGNQSEPIARSHSRNQKNRAETDSLNMIWFNDGQGNFTQSEQTLGNIDVNDLQTADINGDGFIDIIAANNGPNGVWLNNGDGTFNDTKQPLALSKRNSAAFGDVDNDNDIDIYIANNGPDIVWLNDGDNYFTASDQLIATGNSETVVLEDIDLDGDLDAIIKDETGYVLWLNDGHGNFTVGRQRLSEDGDDLIVSDIDEDGDLDILIVRDGADYLLLNETLTPHPMIQVMLNGQLIHNKQTNPIDFGIAPLGDVLTKTFLVSNQGTGALQANSLVASTGFHLAQPERFNVTLVGNNYTTFTMMLTATTAKTYTGALTFTTNISDNDSFSFPLLGVLTATTPLTHTPPITQTPPQTHSTNLTTTLGVTINIMAEDVQTETDTIEIWLNTPLTYTLWITNHGLVTATNITLTATLNNHVPFTSTSINCNIYTTTVICPITELPPQTGTMVTLIAIPTTLGEIQFTTTLTATELLTRVVGVSPIITVVKQDNPNTKQPIPTYLPLINK